MIRKAPSNRVHGPVERPAQKAGGVQGSLLQDVPERWEVREAPGPALTARRGEAGRLPIASGFVLILC